MQRFSIHDGPGIRTTVFLQGCNLACFWCHNPESISSHSQLQYFEQNCINCGHCIPCCPTDAHLFTDGRHHFVRERCQGCGLCTEACFAQALVMVGQEMTVVQVIDEVMRDETFYDNSQGGVTFSGGEAMLQFHFLKALLEASRNQGLHTAVDTAGNVVWSRFDELLPLVDLFLYDLKHMDDQVHKRTTGIGNQVILSNLEKLTAKHPHVWIRIPVIPGVNDNSQAMEEMVRFIQGLASVEQIELMPFHRLGESKYKSLGLQYQASMVQPLEEEHMRRLNEIFCTVGLPIKWEKRLRNKPS